MSDEEETAALRPSARPFVVGLVANLLLGVLLLGVPYYRGRERARESARGVVELSACLLDGVPREALGLALPLGERERFATLYEQAPPDWPARCAPILEQIDHEPAIFVLPTPKAAELELSSAVDDMGAALLDLASARASGHGGVPERPLEELARLRGFAAALLLANDLTIDPMTIALDLGPGEAALPAPSRVPLRTGAGFFHVERGTEPVLRVVAADGVGIAEVEVFAPAEGGSARVNLLQLRRPNGARGVIVDREHAWLAWSTAESTCDADERHCAMRATGLGHLAEGVRVMRPEHWLAAHPAGRAQRAISIGSERFTVVARTPEGGLEARVFPRGEAVPPADPAVEEDPISPTRAVATRPLPGAVDFVAEDGRVQVLSRGETGTTLTTLLVGADPASDVILPAPPDAEILEPCGSYLVALGARTAQVFAAGTPWTPLPIEARAPLRGPTEDESSVRIACSGTAIAIGVLDARRSLTTYVCEAGVCAADAWPVSPVASFDVSLHGGSLWVLSSGGEEAPRILVGRAPFDVPPRVLAACWDSGRGMCGPGRFADAPDGAARGALLVTARERSDVLVLALGDQGFRGLPGLVSVAAP